MVQDGTRQSADIPSVGVTATAFSFSQTAVCALPPLLLPPQAPLLRPLLLLLRLPPRCLGVELLLLVFSLLLPLSRCSVPEGSSLRLPPQQLPAMCHPGDLAPVCLEVMRGNADLSGRKGSDIRGGGAE